jgi:hypothetical protein
MIILTNVCIAEVIFYIHHEGLQMLLEKGFVTLSVIDCLVGRTSHRREI